VAVSRQSTGAFSGGRFRYPWPLVLVFVLVVLFLSGLALVAFRVQTAAVVDGQFATLEAVAQLRAQALGQWLGERRIDTAVITRDPATLGLMARWLERRTPETLAPVTALLAHVRDLYDYRRIELRDPLGQLLVVVGGDQDQDEGGDAAAEREAVAAAARQREIALLDLHYYQHHGPGVLGFIAPLSRADGSVMALLVFEQDPERVLLPQIRSWPRSSASGETLLVRTDGGGAVDVLGHEELSARQIAGDAVMAAARAPGRWQGLDYRQQPVLAVGQPVPGSPWGVIAKIDRAEALAGVSRQWLATGALALAALLLAGAALVLLWRRQVLQEALDPATRHWAEAESGRQAWRAAVGSTSRVPARPRWRWQRRALAYGVALVLAVAALVLRQYLAVSFGERPLLILFLLPVVLSAWLGGAGPGLVATAVVALETDYFLIPPGRELGFAFSHDLWQWLVLVGLAVLVSLVIGALQRARRQAEGARVLQVATLASIGDAIITADATGRVTFLNAEAERLTGWRNHQAAGVALDQVFTLTDAGVLEGRHGLSHPVEGHRTPIQGTDGLVVGTVQVFRDISQRRLAEAELRASEARYQALFRRAPAVMLLVDPASGVIVDANGAAEAYYGWPRAQLTTMSMFEINLCPPAELKGIMHELAGATSAREFQFRHRLASGEVRAVEVHCSRLEVAGQARLFSIILDVTVRQQAQAALLESQRRWQLALDTVHAGLWECRPGHAICYWSDELWPLYGLEPGSCRPSHEAWLATVVADDRERVAGVLAAAVAAGEEFDLEWRVLLPEGQPERWLITRARPVLGAEGRIERYIGLVLDISARKQVELALRESELIRQRAQEMARLSPWSADLVRDIFRSEQMAAVLPGWGTHERSMEELQRLIHPDDRERMMAAWQAAQEQGVPYDLEHRVVTTAGERWVHVKAEITRDAEGRPLSAIGMTQDITERKQAKAHILDLAERISIATRAAGIGIWEQDPASHRMVWSDEIYQLCGVAPECFSPSFESWMTLVHPDDAARVRAVRADALAHASNTSLEFRIIRPEGGVRTVRADAVIHRDPQGRPRRVLGTLLDITEFRQALEELQRAKQHAEEANAAKSRFLATMSHELRTPLNAIIGFGDLLLRADVAPAHKEFLTIITQAGKSLLQLIQNILDLTKIEVGKVKSRPAVFDLQGELESVIAQFGSEADRRQLQLTLALAPDLPGQVIGDANLLRQVLVNLIGNALKFTEVGGVVVSVTAHSDPAEPEEDGGLLLFQVRDSGIGIRAENQQRIFEMFEQEEDTMTRRFGGSGLGLTISRELVTLLGGHIWLQSEPGVGSCFSFSARLPPVAPVSAVLAADQGHDGEPLAGASQTVLVVEDDPFSRTLMVRLLEQYGYQVVTAADGLSALALMERQPVALVLMDMQLPVLNGAEATRRIREGAVPGCPADLPVVAVTAYALPGDRDRFLALGVDDYLEKPIDLVAVLSLLQRFLPSPVTELPPSAAPLPEV